MATVNGNEVEELEDGHTKNFFYSAYNNDTEMLRDSVHRVSLSEKRDSLAALPEAHSAESTRMEPTARRSKPSLASALGKSQRDPESGAVAMDSTRLSITFDLPGNRTKENNEERPNDSNTKLKRTKTISWPLSILSTDESAERLKNQLSRAMEKSLIDRHRGFIPESQIKSLITPSTVEQELIRCQHPKLKKKIFRRPVDRKSIQKQARDICGETDEARSISQHQNDQLPQRKEFRKVFAILVLVGWPQKIKTFLKAGICDTDLPFVRAAKHLFKPHQPIHASETAVRWQQCVKGWRDHKIARFEERQWTVLAPVFRCLDDERAAHHEFRREEVLPFTCWKKTGHRGGSGQVYETAIHADHHTFGLNRASGQPLSVFAVKEFFDTTKERFQSEVRILNSLSGERHRHDHLITLLATFQQGETYYFVFPMAKADLLDYWKTIEPSPDENRETALWLAEQCYGLADGLYKIHRWETTTARGLLHPNSIPLYKTTQPDSVRRSHLPNEPETLRIVLGRHGDIKPRNILFFPNEGRAGRGLLKITDFGIAHFSTRESVPASSRGPLGYSIPYRAPEHDCPDYMLSSSYDNWSLGCVYLEFVTWFFGGWDAVDRFEKERLSVDQRFHGFKTPTFFTVEQEKTRVKDVVLQRLHHIRDNCQCAEPAYTEFFSDFLEMVEKNMLIVEKTDPSGCKVGRKTSREIASSISGMVLKLGAGGEAVAVP